MELSLLSGLVLGAFVFAAGFIDSLAGGGGIITLPAYMAFGVPPGLLLGTNKVSSLIGTTVSVWKFRKNIRIEKSILIRMVLLSALAAPLGAGLSRLIDPARLKYIVLAGLIFAAAFVLVNRDFGQRHKRTRFNPHKGRRNRYRVAALMGAYDGFFGPGTGTMLAVFLTRFAGFDLLRATACAKLLNFSSNVFSLAFFLAVGAVNWRLGVVMGAFNIAGNWCGATLGKKKGQKIIRPMIIGVCLLIAGKLLFDVIHG